MSKHLAIASLALWLGGVGCYALPYALEQSERSGEQVTEQRNLQVYYAATQDGCVVGCKTDAEYFASDEYKQAKYANEMLAKFRKENNGGL